jgi:hypothetical protein
MGKLIVECKQYSYTDKSVAVRLGVHPNTVRNAMKTGRRHRLYSRILKVITESGSALSVDRGMSRSDENGENRVNNQGKQARNK